MTGNEPFYPIVNADGYCASSESGVTLHQRFAMAAMQGLLADASNTHFDIETIVSISIKTATLMIKELNRTNQ